MKGAIAIAAASAVLANAVATPAQLGDKPSKRQSGSVPTVTVKGNAFFAGDQRFYIRGVDYQPGGSSLIADPIADVSVCQKNIQEFQKLGINTVRVYSVDNSANHDECMSLMAQAGIYLALDVNTPDYSINRIDPAISYNDVYLQNVFATIDAFAGYDNTLLFFSGNEVINADNVTDAAPYVKATTRDMKQYISSMGYRQIPVGYSAADVDTNRFQMASYMNCGPDSQRSDFFAFNDYSWCDPSSYTQSGWDQKVAQYSSYSIPLFLSEYGCITNERSFQEVASLYGSQMTPVYSGGLVYEYSEEGTGYGLVNIQGSRITETPDFTALAKALAANPAPTDDGGYKQSGSASQCPTSGPHWQVKDFSGTALPAIPAGAVKYMKNGAGKPVGLTGPGSQTAGTPSSGTAAPNSGASSSSSAANPNLRDETRYAPLFACAAAVFFSTIFGASLF